MDTEDIKVLRIEWVDSCSGSTEWMTKEEADEFASNVYTAESIGYLWKETKDSICLVQSIGKDSFHGFILIPKVAITYQEEI